MLPSAGASFWLEEVEEGAIRPVLEDRERMEPTERSS
jgi:hypothetical protein